MKSDLGGVRFNRCDPAVREPDEEVAASIRVLPDTVLASTGALMQQALYLPLRFSE
jgi:hypothetical protein